MRQVVPGEPAFRIAVFRLSEAMSAEATRPGLTISSLFLLARAMDWLAPRVIRLKVTDLLSLILAGENLPGTAAATPSQQAG